MKKLRNGFVGLTFVALMLLAPIQASANSTLPLGNEIFVSSFTGPTTETFSIDANFNNVVATSIGTTSSLSNVRSGDYSPLTQKSYLVGEDGSQCNIGELNTSTGQINSSVGITYNGSNIASCPATDIDSSGIFWITIAVSSVNYLAQVNPDSGVVSNLVPLTANGSPFYVDWLASNPVTGTMYGGELSTGIYTLDTSTGVMSLVTSSSPLMANAVFSADFDDLGTLWATQWPGGPNELWSAMPADNFASASSQGVISPNQTNYYNAIFITGTHVPSPTPEPIEPELANTGFNLTSTGLIMAGLFLSGLAALGLRLRK